MRNSARELFAKPAIWFAHAVFPQKPQNPLTLPPAGAKITLNDHQGNSWASQEAKIAADLSSRISATTGAAAFVGPGRSLIHPIPMRLEGNLKASHLLRFIKLLLIAFTTTFVLLAGFAAFTKFRLESQRKQVRRDLREAAEQRLNQSGKSGAPRRSLEDFLTLHQIQSGVEPDCLNFEVPIAFAELGWLGLVDLLVDPDKPGEGVTNQIFAWEPTENGNCVFEWPALLFPPGRHEIRAELRRPAPRHTEAEFKTFVGPPLIVSTTNLCQFDWGGILTFQDFVDLKARVFEPGTTYGISIQLTNGQIVRTLSGMATNGEIRTTWDFRDDAGVLLSSVDAFTGIFWITNFQTGKSVYHYQRNIQ